MPKSRSIRLPDQWPQHVKSGVIHAIGLASVALSYARGRAAGRRRLGAELDQAKTEIALLREELAIIIRTSAGPARNRDAGRTISLSSACAS